MEGPLGNGRGRGVAFVESFGTPTAEVVEVTMTDRGIRIDKVWVAVDVGKVVDPMNFENQVQGGVVWGLGHAMNCELTYAKGAVQQTNYNHHEAMRIYQCPVIEIRGTRERSQSERRRRTACSACRARARQRDIRGDRKAHPRNALQQVH